MKYKDLNLNFDFGVKNKFKKKLLIEKKENSFNFSHAFDEMMNYRIIPNPSNIHKTFAMQHFLYYEMSKVPYVSIIFSGSLSIKNLFVNFFNVLISFLLQKY